MIIRSAFFLLLCFISLELFSQRNAYKRKNRAIFPDELQFHMKGWHFAPGFTYMLTRFDQFSRTTDDDLQLTIDPSGGLRPYLELGRYHILEYSEFFKYLDYGIAYKGLGGRQSMTLENEEEFLSKFGNHFLLAYFNLNNIIPLSDYNFIQNTIGINADYRFIGNSSGGVDFPGAEASDPGNLVAQVHYKLGYGFKVNQGLLIIPAIETPLLNMWPFEWGRSSLGYFQSRYRPLIVSVRFLFLREKRLKNCKPVFNPDLPGGKVIPDGMER